MNTEPPIQKKTSWLARILFSVACLATLIALFYAEEDWRGWHQWHQFQAQCAAQGEHLDLASVIPPPVPDDQNFALTPIVFTSYGYILTREGKLIPSEKRDPNFVQRMRIPPGDEGVRSTEATGDRVRLEFTKLETWQSYYRALAAKTNEFPVPAVSRSPAADVLYSLSKYDEVIAELRAAAQLPESRYPINYASENPWDIYLPHLATIKVCSLTLRLRSIAELQNDQPQQALDDVILGLQLTDKIRTEPILISHLVRIASLQLLLQPIWEGLAQHRWSDEQLAKLDAELAQIDFFPAYHLSLQGELGGQTGGMAYVRRHPGRLEELFGTAGLDGQVAQIAHPGHVLIHFVPSGWLYQNEYRSARLLVEYHIPAADPVQRTFSPEMVRRGESVLEKETRKINRYNWYEKLVVPALHNCVRKFAYAQSSLDLSRIAIALERYRLAHGEYPQDLAALTPKFMTAVPSDVIGGQPLKYRREADGRFVLYSVGWNQTDDGGKVVFQHSSQPRPAVDYDRGDWVWEYPQP